MIRDRLVSRTARHAAEKVMKSMHGFEITFVAAPAKRSNREQACRSCFTMTGPAEGQVESEQGSVEHRRNGDALDQHQVIGEQLAEQVLHQSHGNDVTGSGVAGTRKFLQRAGWSAEGELTAPAAVSPRAATVRVVVDHHEAMNDRLGTDPHDTGQQEIEPYDPHHCRRPAKRKQVA